MLDNYQAHENLCDIQGKFADHSTINALVREKILSPERAK